MVFEIRDLWKEKNREEDRKGVGEWAPWFRGEPAEYPTQLRPNLYRPQENAKKKNILHAEQELRVEFRRRAAQMMAETRPADKWEWYFLMAHHHAPTRLLDWSDSALVALYFAVAGQPQDKELRKTNPAVYMLDPWWLNGRVFKLNTGGPGKSEGVALPDWEEVAEYLPDELDSEDLSPKWPVAVDPSHLSRRLAAQRSRFTIFGREPNPLAPLLGKKRIEKISLDRSACQTILSDLETCGTSQSTIYPDLDGLGRELSLTWQTKYLEGGTGVKRVVADKSSEIFHDPFRFDTRRYLRFRRGAGRSNITVIMKSLVVFGETIALGDETHLYCVSSLCEYGGDLIRNPLKGDAI